MNFNLLILVILFSGFFLFGCKKLEYRSNCCTHEISISPCLPSDSMAIYAPNAFTPNLDGINDFYEIGFDKVSNIDFHIKIYQKRKTHFESDDQNFRWNGVVKDKLKEGVYSYDITGNTEGGTPFEATGKFCLLFNNTEKNTKIKNCESCTFPDMIDNREGFFYPTLEQLEDCISE